MAKTKKEPKEEPQRQEGGVAKLQAIKLAMDQIEKQYGRGSIMRLGGNTNDKFKIEVIPTGSIALDIALGVGGFPRGKIIEIAGHEKVGKTALVLDIVAQAQAKELQVIYFGFLSKNI